MNIFKTKKFILITLIFILFSTFSFAMLQVFHNDNVQLVHAANVEPESLGEWKDEDGDGIYTCSLTASFPASMSSANSIMTLKLNEQGILKFKYSNTAGQLQIIHNGNTLSTYNGKVTSLTDYSINLTGSDTIEFKCIRKAWGSEGTANVGAFSLEQTMYSIQASASNDSLGSVTFTNGEYIAGTNLTVTASPNSGTMFFGFVDETGAIVSTNTTYSFVAVKSTTLTALYGAVTGSNTEQDPYSLTEFITSMNSYLADGAVLSYSQKNSEFCKDYYFEVGSNFSLLLNDVEQTATNGIYHLSVGTGNSVVKFVSGTQQFVYTIINPGLAGTTITKGFGTDAEPYQICIQSDFEAMETLLNGIFALGNDINLSGTFTPIGTSEKPFTGKFYGNNHTISNLKMSNLANSGLFGCVSGATISNLTLENVKITRAGTKSGMLIGCAITTSTTVNNVKVSGTLQAISNEIGGLVGYADDKKTVQLNGCEVHGEISTSAQGNIGGLTGAGGSFDGCTVFATVKGIRQVGGITGGYQIDSVVKNCLVAGEIILTGQHTNNYPYWGLVNGYGAYSSYSLTNSGQRVTVDFSSTKQVEEVKIFNSNLSADGIPVSLAQTGTNYTFTENIFIDGTYASTSALDETKESGITGNYGGFTIRFKMADGTYKYLSTLNKEESKFQSVFDVNLDDLTSYVDNFKNIEIDTTIGTKTFVGSGDIAVWGTAVVNNANDFEHLSWIINGGIPTTFANDIYYNQRSVATISVKLGDNIDLTTERKDANNNVLNKDSSGNIIHNFYGLGKTEMHPYRGSFYGNNKSLTVNMDFENAYCLGIINVITEQTGELSINDLTVNGIIKGGYRVGIVGMNDNYARECYVTFNNVINNANITAKNQVGGFIGIAQGNGKIIDLGIVKYGAQKNAEVILNNCVNNGNVTATAGNAGGFIGTLNHRDNWGVATLNVCTNNGIITASAAAGGFIGSVENVVTVNGINVSAGIVNGKTIGFYVGNMKGSYTMNGTLKTLYKINIGEPNFEFKLTATGTTLDSETISTDSNGIAYAYLLNCNSFSGVTLDVKVPLLLNAISLIPQSSNNDQFNLDSSYKKTMATSLTVPINITIWSDENNKYVTTSSSENWTLKADVKFSRNIAGKTTNVETIDLIPYVGEEKLETLLNSNQLVFANVTFKHEIYKITDTFSQYLYRITEDVEDYVEYAHALLLKESGTNAEFKTLGKDAKDAYDALYEEISNYSSDNLTYFESYIANTLDFNNIKDIDASYNVLKPYYENIAVTIVGETTQTLTYGKNALNETISYNETITFNKTIKFTMLSGEVTKEISYSFEKSDISNELKATVSTAGVSFKVGEVTTCSYAEDVLVTINKIDISKVEIENAEYVYCSTPQENNVTLTVMVGDSVNYTLSYNGKSSATEVGTYEVKISAISGLDAKFYNIPAEYTAGQLVISPVKYTLNVNTTELVYYKDRQQAYNFTLVQNASDYEIKNSDYKTTYSGLMKSGDEYAESETKPTEAGEYTAKITLLNSNLEFSTTNENKKEITFNFEIKQKQLTTFSFDTVLEYNGQEKEFTFEFEDLCEGDELLVTYEVQNEEGNETIAKNAYDKYKLKVLSIGNPNYYFETLSKGFVINQEKLTITLGDQSSIYGDNIVVEQTDYEITSGTVYGEEENKDDLKIELTTNATSTSAVDGEYSITAEYDNSNYDITFVSGNYTIEKRTASIPFVEKSEYDYVASNIYSQIEVKSSTLTFDLTNILENDVTSFNFILVDENDKKTEFRNAGTYTLKLVENEETNKVLKNYSIAIKEASYKINPKAITLKPKQMEVPYTAQILESDFELEVIDLGEDELKDIVEFKYIVCKLNDEEAIDYTNLDVDFYTIRIVITNTELSLYNNYAITLDTNTLEIVIRDTKILENVYTKEKIYDAEKIDFSAKLVDLNNNEISGATIEYEILFNGEKLAVVENVGELIKNAGTYTINVKGTAGDNNKEATKNYTIVIKPNYVTITLNNPNKIYDGKTYVPEFKVSHSKTQDDVHSLIQYSILIDNEEKEAINAYDGYSVKFNVKADNAKNYIISNPLISFEIKPIELTLTIKEKTITYGEEFDIQKSIYSLSKDLLPGESLNLAFSSENLKTIVGDYDITAKNTNTNYDVTVIGAKLHITKRVLKLNYSGINTLSYNEAGYPDLRSVKVENALKDDVYSVYYLNSDNDPITIVNAGDYSLNVKLNDTHNYKFENSDKTLISEAIKITKKSIELNIEIESKVYDGEVIKFNVYFGNTLLDTNLYNFEFYQGITKLSYVPKDASKYTIKIVEKFSNNYEFSKNSEDFEIYLKEVRIEEIAKEYDYTRSTIKPILTLTSEDVKLDYTYVESEGMFKEVGDYTIQINGLTGANAHNYKLISEDTITYSIVPINAQVKLGKTEFVFTNKQLTKQQLGISFVSTLNILESDYSLSELPTNVNVYTIAFESKNAGIIFDIDSFEVEITKADIEGINFIDKSVNYNNQSHSIYVDKTTLANGIKLNVEYSGSNFVDAGTYNVTATLTNNNYNTKVLTATLEIKQATEQVSVSKIVDFTYNSEMQGVEILGLEKAWYNQLISFSYIGENYSSIVKPTNAGTYKLVIKSNNENNLKITNAENEFVINTKAITITSLQTQTTTYNAQTQEFNVSTIGVIDGETVAVKVQYNGEDNLPKNVGNYKVEFVGLTGTDASNYHIENKLATSTLVINKYCITVKAENKTVVYGEQDVPLTYVSDSLLGSDVFSGEIKRESGKNVNSYIINQGSLDAGENYEVKFENAVYNITQRELKYVDFQKEFTYNGTSQIPNVIFTNLVDGDFNVAKVNIAKSEDTINAGTYKLQFVILNPNYKLPEISTFDIKINKLSSNDKIVALLTTSKDYDGESFEPMIMIDGDYDYTLSYSVNDEKVEEMVDAGTYLVTVELIAQNYEGTKSFEFTVNKIDYDKNVINNISVEISSNKFILSGLNNILVSVDNVNFVENQVENLTSKTSYNVYVKVLEDKNHRTTTFLLGKFNTCASALVLNEHITEIINKQVVLTDIDDIKEILKDCENLSEIEQSILNDENYINLINQYENYFNGIQKDVEEVKIVSDIVDFGVTGRIRKLSSMFNVFGLGIVLMKKGKKKDEFNS